MSYRNRLKASVAFMPDSSPAGVFATAIRTLLAAGPNAAGCTLINPDGTARYISRAEAERLAHEQKPAEVRQ